MALLKEWQKVAYNEKTPQNELQKFWQRYFLLEKGVYEKLLTNPDEVVEGTVKELADKYGIKNSEEPFLACTGTIMARTREIML